MGGFLLPGATAVALRSTVLAQGLGSGDAASAPCHILASPSSSRHVQVNKSTGVTPIWGQIGVPWRKGTPALDAEVAQLQEGKEGRKQPPKGTWDAPERGQSLCSQPSAGAALPALSNPL